MDRDTQGNFGCAVAAVAVLLVLIWLIRVVACCLNPLCWIRMIW